MPEPSFITVGKQKSIIPVVISYRIIELFSEGLYSSPNKAVEELVSNAFDAGALNVHVILSADRTTEDAVITVIDDGTGMDPKELENHWLIGVSNKRRLSADQLPKGRKQIGKFGIGKLATFVLARYLTHVCKRGKKYYAATMDYQNIPEGESGGIHTEEKVEIPLRELTEQEAKTALADFTGGSKPGNRAIPLFGKNAPDSWTVAIMSGLKPMAVEIRKGRLSWVLRTALPLRDDFKIFLDGEELKPSKASVRVQKKWILGKDSTELSKPAPDDLEPTEDKKSKDERYGLTHPALGRITGYAELYEDFLTEGKSAEIGRSNGFFVYVRGRLINEDDAFFGLPPLRHGTFARFRMVVHMDNLDKDLRSSRETVRKGSLVEIARKILQAVFNQVRNWDEEHEAEQSPDVRATGRISQTPGSLSRRPILAVVRSTFEKSADPQYTYVNRQLAKNEREDFLTTLQERAESDQGLVVNVELVDLAQDRGIAIYDAHTGILRINTLHPFVAAHRDDHGLAKDTLILLAMAEVLTEAHLYELGLKSDVVKDAMNHRDELLRYFTRHSGKRNAHMMAQALLDAASDETALENELVSAFQSMGFEAVRLSGPKKADGRADAHLGASGGQQQRYGVSLEAKSKADGTGKVKAKDVDVAAVMQHRNSLECEHALVVAPQFPIERGEASNLVIQARTDKEQSGRTITFIKVADLARLVRLVSLKGVTLDRLRGLFQNCISPEESAKWIDELMKHKPTKPKLKEILETIWKLQQERPFEAVEFAVVAHSLQRERNITLRKEQVIDLCRTMAMMASQVVVRDTTVELVQSPDNIIQAFGAALEAFPEDEQTTSVFRM